MQRLMLVLMLMLMRMLVLVLVRVRVRVLMLVLVHCSGGCHGGRIMQCRGRMMQRVLVGCGLLGCGGLLHLWILHRLHGRRLDGGGRYLWLMEPGRCRIERHRQHLLQSHPRDAPRNVPRAWMVLHLHTVTRRTRVNETKSPEHANHKKGAREYLQQHFKYLPGEISCTLK